MACCAVSHEKGVDDAHKSPWVTCVNLLDSPWGATFPTLPFSTSLSPLCLKAWTVKKGLSTETSQIPQHNWFLNLFQTHSFSTPELWSAAVIMHFLIYWWLFGTYSSTTEKCIVRQERFVIAAHLQMFLCHYSGFPVKPTVSAVNPSWLSCCPPWWSKLFRATFRAYSLIPNM